LDALDIRELGLVLYPLSFGSKLGAVRPAFSIQQPKELSKKVEKA
jgi:hypothetical protein